MHSFSEKEVRKMKIVNLSNHGNKIYTSNVYLVTANWNGVSDPNTLIDVGRDISIIERIDEASTGIGKKRVEQVFLTHNHYDHASLLPVIKKKYSPTVYAFSNTIDFVDVILNGGEIVKIADREFEIIHIQGHSSDSICLYCEEDRVLFAGDTPIYIRHKDKSYDNEFVSKLSYIASKR